MLYIALGQPVEKRILPYPQRKASGLGLEITQVFFWTIQAGRVY
jgi:hypothetical protein